MRRALPLTIASAILVIIGGVQCRRLVYLVQDLAKWRQEQRKDLAQWEEWERVGKAQVAAGSKTTFTPDPFWSKGIQETLLHLKQLMLLAVLIVIGSISSAFGLLSRRRWAYRLALVYASIAVGWGVFEMVPVGPSVPLMYIYSKQWVWFLFILATGLLPNGLLLWCLLRPAVKAQFIKTATSDK